MALLPGPWVLSGLEAFCLNSSLIQNSSHFDPPKPTGLNAWSPSLVAPPAFWWNGILRSSHSTNAHKQGSGEGEWAELASLHPE